MAARGGKSQSERPGVAELFTQHKRTSSEGCTVSGLNKRGHAVALLEQEMPYNRASGRRKR